MINAIKLTIKKGIEMWKLGNLFSKKVISEQYRELAREYLSPPKNEIFSTKFISERKVDGISEDDIINKTELEKSNEI